MGLATEARYSIRPAPEVCVCDLWVTVYTRRRYCFLNVFFVRDINYLWAFRRAFLPIYRLTVFRRSCPSPPPNVVSVKQQRERYRQRLLAAFESHYHPDHSVPRLVVTFTGSFDSSFHSIQWIQRGFPRWSVQAGLQNPSETRSFVCCCCRFHQAPWLVAFHPYHAGIWSCVTGQGKYFMNRGRYISLTDDHL